MATALYRFPAIKQTSGKELATAQTEVRPAESPAENALEHFSLTPLSAGDIIDRGVRLYRQQLLAFIRIVLPPTLVAYAGGILLTMGARNFSSEHGDWRMFLMGGAILLGLVMWVVGKAAFLMVMGASTRALVFHFFNGTPILARDVYRAVRERIWGLLGATIVLALLAVAMLITAYMVAAFVAILYFIAVMALAQYLPAWVMGVMHFVFGALLILALLAGALAVYARIVYTPQAMMVEGKGFFDAFGRSFTLAKGEFLRIGAVLLFQVWVAWSLYALLLVPLGWYSYFHESEGLSLTSLFDTTGPLWFNIAQQTLTQIGEILIAPIILLSFTLLYINSRVRKEGFDVELIANRVLPPAKFEMKAAPAPAPVQSNVPRPAIDWSEELAHDELFGLPPEAAPSEQTAPIIETAPPALSEPFTETVEIAPVPIAPAARYCPACGSSVNERARFCPACGEQL